MSRELKHGDTLAARMRGAHSVQLLSPFNDKTPKGEGLGWLTAMLYLAPHTLGGPKTLCPHSTEGCRAACLYAAGRGSFQKTKTARLRRTALWHADRRAFMARLVDDLIYMTDRAEAEGMRVAVRLNGTSDILWEREPVGQLEHTLLTLFPQVQFYDYTRTPIEHRRLAPNYRLTYSLADDPLERAVAYLRAGQSVAAVVPEEEKAAHESWFVLRDQMVTVIDGDLHDLRFLDPDPALVLLRPKGAAGLATPLIQANLIPRLRALAT